MNPTPGDVHVNTPLSNISVAYLQQASDFIAGDVFPNVPVPKQSDRYYIYDRGDFNRDEMKERAPGTESAGGGYNLDNTPTYFCRVRAYHKDVTDEVRANSDPALNPDNDAAEYISAKGLIKKERIFADTYMVGGVWTNDFDGVAATPGANETLQWNDPTSTPIEDIRAAKTAVKLSGGFMPNTLVLGQQVLDSLMDHPDLVDRVKYGTQSGVSVVDLSELRALFKIERILIMGAIRNTAVEGAAETNAFIGGKKAFLCYSAPRPGLMVPTAGYTFSWNGLLGASAFGTRVRKFRMDPINSDRVEIDMSFDMKVVSADLGFFWDTIVA